MKRPANREDWDEWDDEDELVEILLVELDKISENKKLPKYVSVFAATLELLLKRNWEEVDEKRERERNAEKGFIDLEEEVEA